MLTPQEVSTHAFTKAVMGGYNMAMVDEFLDELTDDYTALYKENAGLKSKMKVLVEKVEDYRATEDSMRATLLTAQKMADSIVHEAEVRRDQVLAQAETDARVKIGQLQQELADAEMRLQQGQLEMARFIAGSRELCAKELSFLDKLPALDLHLPDPAIAAAAAEEAAAVEEIGERVMAGYQEEAAEEVPAEPRPAEAPSAAQTPVAADYPEGDPFSGEEGATRKIRLSDLKFGRNYSANEK